MTTPSPAPGLPSAATAESPTATAETPSGPQSLHRPDAHPQGRRLALLTLTALGVVFGDIGTSPLYTLQECFSREHGVPATIPDVYGVLSLIVLSLTMIVTIKYVTFIMRADNKGEGGILALLALIMQRRRRDDDRGSRYILISLALFGAALLYGDGIITPAISVLGAVDGLKVISPAFERWVVIVTIVILVGLFSFQRSGTERVGRMFGPVMLVWFTSIAVLGIAGFRHHPEILKAVWPGYGIAFFFRHGVHGFVILGSVVLAVTGAEALYADMGHFGKKPIRLAWLSFVFPCLLLNYFGQGALLIAHPEAAANPFYLLAPRALQLPLIVIATMAAIVASQALISGAFSLTQQAVQLGFVPRLDIRHTSHHAAGQIYIPEVNQALALGCIVVVLFFKSATALGAAYGIAVTGTMAITTLLFHVIAREQWGWPAWKATAASATFLAIDLAFFGANVLKIEQGGWVPLAIGVGLFTLMRTWKEGRRMLWTMLQGRTLPMSMFIDDVARKKPLRVKGTSVFLTSTSEGAPVVLLHHLKHNQVLHEQVVLLSIGVADVPDVDTRESLLVEELGEGFFRVQAMYGFMQQPSVPDIMKYLNARGVKTRPMATSYYLGREQLIPIGPGKMARWRKQLFIFMSRNARSATEFFAIPPNRVVELGTQIEF